MDQDKRMKPTEPITDIETAQVEGGAIVGDLFTLGVKCWKCRYTAEYSTKLAKNPCPKCGGVLSIVDLRDYAAR